MKKSLPQLPDEIFFGEMGAIFAGLKKIEDQSTAARSAESR